MITITTIKNRVLGGGLKCNKMIIVTTIIKNAFERRGIEVNF
jgi:hypothetical protein